MVKIGSVTVEIFGGGCSSSSCCDRGKTKSTLSLKTKPRVWQYIIMFELGGLWHDRCSLYTCKTGWTNYSLSYLDSNNLFFEYKVDLAVTKLE